MTMLKNKHITFSLIMVCLIMMVSPMAKAQLGGLLGGQGGLGGLLGGQGGLGGLLGGQCGIGDLGGVLGLINIQGILHCSANGNASAPAFPNAGVQLQCGGQKNVVSTSTTNGAGIFSILVNPIQLLLSTLISDCRLAVTTSLSTCNASLPSVDQLLSPLTIIGKTVSGLLTIANLIPTGFLLA